jgi:hypothetical protein
LDVLRVAESFQSQLGCETRYMPLTAEKLKEIQVEFDHDQDDYKKEEQ